MQRVRRFVRRQRVAPAVDLKTRAGNAVGDAPGKRAEMRAVLEIGLKRLEPEHHRAHAARHRHAPVAHRNAVADNVDLDTRVAGQPELVDARPLVLAERTDCNRHEPLHPLDAT
jgi:hypothetical protein